MIGFEIKQKERMKPLAVRLPSDAREKLQNIAKAERAAGKKITESDVARTAILLYLQGDFTDSKDSVSEVTK
jgi:hypothetical protein